MSKLYLFRGTPGSGKSTAAKSFLDCLIVEADQYFIRNGEYKWEGGGRNHIWCQDTVRRALENGIDVAVCNTFTRISEMVPYLEMASSHNSELVVIKCIGRFKNTHNVPVDKLHAMTERWEDFSGEFVLDMVPRKDREDKLENHIKPAGPTVVDILHGLHTSDGVSRKELSDGIVSYNYKKDVFFHSRWNPATIKARGLFMRGDKVVARSFDKFFRVNECDESSVEHIWASYDRFRDNIRVYRKYNGFLAVAAYDDEKDEGFVASKSTNEGDFAKCAREALELDSTGRSFFETIENVGKNIVRGHSFVFEIIDNERDPHFIAADNFIVQPSKHLPTVRLIGVFENNLENDGLTESEVYTKFGCEIASFFAAEQKAFSKLLRESTSEEQFESGIRVMAEGTSVSEIEPEIEGYVIEIQKGDGHIIRFKVKTALYAFWKYVRGKLVKELKNAESRTYPEIQPWSGWTVEFVNNTSLMDEAVITLDSIPLREIDRKCYTKCLLGKNRLDMLKVINLVKDRMHGHDEMRRHLTEEY